MANALSSLVVRLGLDAAEFTSGLTKSEYDAKKFADRLKRDVETATSAATVAMVGLGAAGVAAFVALRQEVENVAGLKQLSEQIGDTAENVAALKTVAATSGVALDTVAAASIKLTAGLSKSDDETKGAAAAIKALGLNLDDFLQLRPVEQLEAIANQLAKFEDGAGKTAFAVAAFGKAGASVLPFLNDLADVGGRQIRLTQEQIEAADRYSKQQARTKAELQGLLQLVAVESLHAFTSFTGALVDTGKAMLGVDKEAKNLTGDDIKGWAETSARALGFVVDAGDGVARTFQIAGKSIAGFLAARQALLKGEIKEAIRISLEAYKDIDDVLMRPFFSDRLAARLAAPPPPAASARPVLDPARFRTADAKTEADEYEKALEALGKSAASSLLELNALAIGTGEVTDAMKTLAKLQADKVWSSFNEEQRKTITTAYEGLDAIQKQTAALKQERDEREKLIKAYQDQQQAQEKAREQLTQAIGSYAEQNAVLERQLAIVGQDELAHNKLVAALEHEKLATQDMVATNGANSALLDELYQKRLKLLDSFDAAKKQLEEQRKTKQYTDEIGESIARAGEDWLVYGRKASDVLKSLEQDLLRLLLRRMVLNPLARGISDFLSGGGLGSLGGAAGLPTPAPWTGGFDLPGLASGTNFHRGGYAVVGEYGKEVVRLPRGAQVIPNSELVARRGARGGGDINVSVSMPRGSSRQTGAQFGAVVAREISIAHGRNG